MLGLMYFGGAALFIVLLISAVLLGWRRGRAKEESFLKAASLALIAFLVVCLPIFWNLFPIALAYRKMCDADSGFRAFARAEDWARANENRIVRLRGSDLDRTTPSKLIDSGFLRYEFFGGMLARETRADKIRRYGMDFVRTEDRIVDVQTDKALTRRVNYSVGSSEDVRFWLVRRSCSTPDDAAVIAEQTFLNVLRGMAK